jgi:D-alanine-D-alanine ligase
VQTGEFPLQKEEGMLRLGLVLERKRDFVYRDGDPEELNSELLADFEEDALLGGLRDAGFDVLRIGDARRLVNRVGYWRHRCDLVFNLSTGYRGIERKLLAAAVLEVAEIPYVGSTPYVLTLTRHKFHAKLVAQAAGVNTPPAVLFIGVPPDWSGVRFPVIVKPVAESSSIGITADAVAFTEDAALQRAAFVLERYVQPAIIETFIAGVEVEVPLLVDPVPRALGVIAIYRDGAVVDGTQILTSSDVYGDGYAFGPPPSYVDLGQLRSNAERVATALGIRDYGRVDFRVEPSGTSWFIEASSHPHLQRLSSFYTSAMARGLSYDQMLAQLVAIARRRLGL